MLLEQFLQFQGAGTTLLTAIASLVVGHTLMWARAQELWILGLAAPWHVESFLTRDQTLISCIGRWILNHRTTREVFFLPL